MLSLYFESTPAVLPLLPRVTWLADLLYSLGVDDDATAPTGGCAFVRFTLAAATGSSSRCRSHTSNLFWHTCTCALLLCADSVFSSLLNRFRSRWAPKISRSHAIAEFVWMQRKDLSFFLLCLLMWQPGKLRLPPPSPLRPHSAGRCKLGPAKLEFRSKCCL